MRDRLGHHGGDRHDRHGFLRPVLIDQYRHQHDRRAGADDAADGAGDQPDREDEEEAQRGGLREAVPRSPHSEKVPSF
jgi:hypothetical protein